MHLYETHIPVASTTISEAFYREVVGLPFAYRGADRDIVFLWVGGKEKGMLGLWGPTTFYGKKDGADPPRHFAFAVTFEELLRVIGRLQERGIETTGFGGKPTREPTVIGWMPSAQIYFRDPDGHMLEYIAILDDPPDASFHGPFSEWKGRVARPS
jgi:lactoylglutathione lyase